MTKTMTIPRGKLNLSDAHLKIRTWASRPDIQEDSYCAFDKAIEMCIKHSLSMVIEGDLFDSVRPTPDAVLRYIEGVDRMEAAGLPVFAICGNHDPRVNHVAWFELHSWTIDIHKDVFEPYPGMTAYGLDYLPRNELEEELANVPPDAEMLILHQAQKLILPFDGSWNLDEDAVPASVKCVFLGDLHDGKFSESNDTHFYYGSCTHVQDIGEDGNRWFTIDTIDPTLVAELAAAGAEAASVAGRVTVLKMPFASREFTYHDLSLGDMDDVNALAAELSKMPKGVYPTPIVRIKFSKALRGAMDTVIEPVAEDRFYLWKTSVNVDVDEAGIVTKLAADRDAEVATKLNLPTLAEQATGNEEAAKVLIDLIRKDSVPSETLAAVYKGIVDRRAARATKEES